MKVKVGDKVKFLNDTGAGEVTRIVDQTTALVIVDGGFEVPWLIRDLVVDTLGYNMENDAEIEVVEEEFSETFSESIGPEKDQGLIEDEEVLLAFLPDKSSSEFETYLINSSSYHFKYTIARKQVDEMVLFHEDTLEPGVKIHLGSYRPGNVNDEEIFRIQGLFFNAGFYNHLAPVDLMIRVSAAEMYTAESRKENDYFHEKAILHSLYDWRKPKEEPKMVIDAEQLKKAMYTKGEVEPVKVKVKEAGPVEVDLHIEQLMENHKSLINSEIIDIQLSRFRTALESAILHKTPRVVFIHGVGNGKLKHDIRHIIDTEYKSIRYQDASFREYGYGATMAIIR
ncbi:MAG: DUF2027 domain-containing protein [Bacteroidales bacterium]